MCVYIYIYTHQRSTAPGRSRGDEKVRLLRLSASRLLLKNYSIGSSNSYESGRAIPDPALLQKLRRVLGVKLK